MGSQLKIPVIHPIDLRSTEIVFDISKTRERLIMELADWAWMPPPQIILALQPERIFPADRQVFKLPGVKRIIKMKVFIVPLFQTVSEQMAISILANLGLESVNVEEALTCGLHKGFWHNIGSNHNTVVLSAKYIRPGSEKNPEFLTFNNSNGGGEVIGIHPFEYFSLACFLAKQKDFEVEKWLK